MLQLQRPGGSMQDNRVDLSALRLVRNHTRSERPLRAACKRDDQ
jgi:hypothetical protein